MTLTNLNSQTLINVNYHLLIEKTQNKNKIDWFFFFFLILDTFLAFYIFKLLHMRDASFNSLSIRKS